MLHELDICLLDFRKQLGDADSDPENSEIFLHYLNIVASLLCGNSMREFHKIIEYTNLVVTHKDH